MNTATNSPTAFSNFLSDFQSTKKAFVETTPTLSRKADFKKRFDYSAKGHLKAIDIVYKEFFGKNSKILDVTGKDSYLDTQIGVDYIVEVENPRLQKEVQFWVQERFRTVKYQSYQSVTLIENNCYSGNLSEVYKSKAQFLVYGYYDEQTEILVQAVVVSLPQLFQKIAMNQINFEIIKNKQTNQNFISVKFNELRKYGLIAYEFDFGAN